MMNSKPPNSSIFLIVSSSRYATRSHNTLPCGVWIRRADWPMPTYVTSRQEPCSSLLGTTRLEPDRILQSQDSEGWTYLRFRPYLGHLTIFCTLLEEILVSLLSQLLQGHERLALRWDELTRVITNSTVRLPLRLSDFVLCPARCAQKEVVGCGERILGHSYIQ